MGIVERLRMKGPMSFQMDWSDRAKAADEIERLREVIANMTNLSNDLWNIGATALMGEEDA
jgi:hypothetical protein